MLSLNIIDQISIDDNENKHGLCVYYYTNSQIELSCNYYHGIRHGLFERYFLNGQYSYRGHYNMGKKIGYWKFYGTRRYYYLCLI